jgi:insertion element IS1 protein InsB
MTEAWSMSQASTSHAISKKYTQRIERHNLNLLAAACAQDHLLFEVEAMHNKIIGDVSIPVTRITYWRRE